MKIRTGFVSNSSSSSFVAVLTRKREVRDFFIDKFPVIVGHGDEYLYESDKFISTNYGIYKENGSGVEVHSSCGDLYWIGMQVMGLLQKDMTVSECKKLFIKKMKVMLLITHF